MHDLRAGIDGNGLTDGFSAYGKSRHQGRHGQRNPPGPANFRIGQDQGRDGRGSAAGNNAADIAHHIVADGADPLRIAQKQDCFMGAGNLPGPVAQLR